MLYTSIPSKSLHRRYKQYGLHHCGEIQTDPISSSGGGVSLEAGRKLLRFLRI